MSCIRCLVDEADHMFHDSRGMPVNEKFDMEAWLTRNASCTTGAFNAMGHGDDDA